jgi:hypothetical protein
LVEKKIKKKTDCYFPISSSTERMFIDIQVIVFDRFAGHQLAAFHDAGMHVGIEDHYVVFCQDTLQRGNAYVDEILYEARISPFSKANKIPADQVAALARAIETVLRHAENHIFQNFPDTITEKERDFLQVHRPKQKLTLAGEEVLKAEINKRKTYYTESQVLYE